MKKRGLCLMLGALLICASFGLTACGEGYANYFNVIKNPKNFRIEYVWQDESFTEIRVKNKVALKTTWDGGGTNTGISNIPSGQFIAMCIKNKVAKPMTVSLPALHLNYRQEVSRREYEKSATTFLGREAVLYQRTSVSGYVATPDSETVDRENTVKFIVDKEYDIVLAQYFAWDGDDEQVLFEVTLFEVGGQEIPDNPQLPLD